MLSYRHAFHAGNHADVLKHLGLLAVLEGLNRKPKPWCYFETHAGAGRYDIRAAAARQTGEYQRAAGRLRTHQARDALLARYIDKLTSLGGAADYPGSPLLAQSCMRAGDELHLCELHPSDADTLSAWAARQRAVHVHRRDGHGACRALLPPQASRGLVLIDPSYERKSEYAQCVETIALIRKRFRAACVALWYPRLPQDPAQSMLKPLLERGEECLHLQLDASQALGDFGMFGSGLLIFNPPWQTDSLLRGALDEVCSLLGPPARCHIEMVNPA